MFKSWLHMVYKCRNEPRDDELVDDFVSVITSMAVRIYGRRQRKQPAEKIKAYVASVMQSEDEQ